MNMLPQSKEECIIWQQEILDKTQQMVAEEHLKYVEAKAKLDKVVRLIYNLEYNPRTRWLSIDEDTLAILGFSVIRGIVKI